MEIFDEFIVVDQKSLTDVFAEKTNCKKCGNYGTHSKFGDVTQFAALEFEIDNYWQRLAIADIGNVSESNDVPLAQIIRWEWNGKGEQVIRETKILNIGGKMVFYYISASSSFVVRILKKREKTGRNPCPSVNPPEDDLTVQIGEEKITVSAHWLMSVSPVIQRMLSVEMREKQQRLITLNELGVDMEQFKEFLGFISMSAFRETILPNPKNVLVLLNLADYFQVNWLKKCCATHLINCVEIPLIDRFLLIDRYQLDNFKNYFLHLNVDNLRAFFKLNREQLLPVVSKEFLGALNVRLCG